MTEKQTLNREAVVKVIALVKPALASASYIPALTHICFSKGYATAYNDITAIQVRAKFDLDVCLPGELLGRALAGFSSESVMLQTVGTDMLISSGRSKLKLPTLPAAQFPFRDADLDAGYEIELEPSIMKGIELCLMSVGNDPTQPAQMGVTLDVADGNRCVLYSTDNASISRYQTRVSIELPGDAPVILPTFFCQQLLALAKVFPEDQMTLIVAPKVVVAEVGEGKARLVTKTPVELEPMDFPRIIKKHVPHLESFKDDATIIPDSWDSAWQRALLVQSAEPDRVTKLVASKDALKLVSTCAMGEAVDVLDFEQGDAPAEPFYVDPSMVARMSKVCGLVDLGATALVLSDSDAKFIHLIAHCSK